MCKKEKDAILATWLASSLPMTCRFGNKQTNKYLPVISAWLSALTLVAKKTHSIFIFKLKLWVTK